MLNCTMGDLRITFDKRNKEEVAKARKVIEDMMKRGYTIVVETKDGKFRPVKKFDARRNAYVILEPGETPQDKPVEKRLPLRKTKAHGVAPTAGG